MVGHIKTDPETFAQIEPHFAVGVFSEQHLAENAAGKQL